MTPLKPAPDAVLQLVKCGCAKERCSTNRCQCRKAGLQCTVLCSCSDNDEGEPCDNAECNSDADDEDGSNEPCDDEEGIGEEEDELDDWNNVLAALGNVTKPDPFYIKQGAN